MVQSSHPQLKTQSCIVLLVMMLMFSCGTAKAGLASDPPQTWSSAPDFELPDLQGNRHQLSDYSGKTVIVNFWAIWCAPCRLEIPAMNRAWAKLKDENIALLAINVGDEHEAIEAFREAHPMEFTVLQDKNDVVRQHWRVTVFPTTFIINSRGQIVYRAVGGREWDEAGMLASIRSIAAD